MMELEEQAIEEVVSSGADWDLLYSRLEEVLVVLGNIQGLLTFCVVVLLCFFVYKFLRMFF